MPKKKSPKFTPEAYITQDNYRGRETNLELCNMTVNIHPDKDLNPLMFRDALSHEIFDLLEPHIDRDQFNLDAVSTVLAMGAEQTLRDINLKQFPHDPTCN